MADFLVTTWLTLNGSSSIFVEWEGGLVDGLLFQRGAFDNQPLINTLNKDYTLPISRNITIGSTNLDTGLFGDFNESLGRTDLLTAISCSACPPWYFPPTNFMGTTWVDGGCVINLDVFAAVERCLLVVPTQAQITVDMIFDSQVSTMPQETNMTTLFVIQRAYEIHNYDSQMWFYYNVMAAYPTVNIRYVVFPSAFMPGGPVPLDFNQTLMISEVQLGKNDTAAVLKGTKTGRQILSDRFEENRQRIIYP